MYEGINGKFAHNHNHSQKINQLKEKVDEVEDSRSNQCTRNNKGD